MRYLKHRFTLAILFIIGLLLQNIFSPVVSAVFAATPSVPVYTNGVESGFTDNSFGFTSRNSCDTTTYTSAPCSYSIAYQGWGAINFIANTPITSNQYTSIDWNVNTKGQSLEDFAILVVDPQGSWINEIQLSQNNVTNTLANGWVHISVPMSMLNPSGQTIGGIQLKNWLNTSLVTIYIDDVMLVGGVQVTGTPTVSPTVSPTATPTPNPTVIPTSTPTPTTVPPTTLGLLPGQQLWKNNVSSYLFGSNDSQDYTEDNFDTDPHNIIQPSLLNNHFSLMRMFIFHYSLSDGHRITLGTNPQIQIKIDPTTGQTIVNPSQPNSHEYDTPTAQYTTVTPYAPYQYELETRLQAIKKSGMQCLIVLKDIRTNAANNTDPSSTHIRITDIDTGKLETDLDFAKRVVAYAGNRCNLYEIGNEPDLDEYNDNGTVVTHMDIQTYLSRWNEFVTELRKINPNAKFIGPVTYNDQGNDCYYSGPAPLPGAQPGDCYMQNFLHGVKASGVYPDAVSFHWYPCDNATDGFNSSGNCGPAQAQTYTTVTQEVKSWVHNDLGFDIPVGITEWNFDPGSNPLGENADFMSKFSTAAMNAMIGAHLDFANQFDAQSYGGYGHLDMFDINNSDKPKAQFTSVSDIISQYR